MGVQYPLERSCIEVPFALVFLLIRGNCQIIVEFPHILIQCPS